MSDGSDEDWHPEDEGFDEDLETEAKQDLLDAEEEEEEEDDECGADDLRDNLEGAVIDPFSLLDRMGAQQTGTDADTGQQPFEILYRNTQEARAQHTRDQAAQDASDEEPPPKRHKGKGKKKGQKGFGATVEDVWDEDLAARMGMGPMSSKSRKKMNARLKRRRKAEAEGKGTKQLPEEVTSKIGQANLLYIAAKFDEAIVLLREVVKLAPNLPDSYQTLGQAHEGKGEKRRALDFYMIAAHLVPKDVDLWRRLASLSALYGFQRQAIYCLTKVLVRDRTDLDARWDRAMLYRDLGELKKAVHEYEQIAVAKPGDSETPKMLAHLYHQLHQPERAIQALERHLASHHLASDSTHANMLAELYIEARRHKEAFEIISGAIDQHCRGSAAIPLDFQVKASICLLHMGKREAARPGLQTLQNTKVESTQDLYQEAATALLETGYPDEALKLFCSLQEAGLGDGELWKRLAECHRSLHDPAGAVEVYTEVIQGEDSSPEAKRMAAIEVAELHESEGQKQQAREALAMLEELGPSDMDTLKRKTQLLLKLGDQEGYLDVMMPLMGATLQQAPQKKNDRKPSNLTVQAKRRRHIIGRTRPHTEEDAVFKGYVTRDRRKPHVVQNDEVLKAALENIEEGDSDGDGEAGGKLAFDSIGRDPEQFKALILTARVLLDSGKPLQASELVAECITRLTKRSTEKMKKETLRVLAAEAALKAREPALALFHLRYACENCPYSVTIWNLFCEAATDLGSLKQAQRAASILQQMIHDCLPLKLVHGHCLSLNNAHGRAVAEYMSAYNTDPDNPLILLCIGVAHLNQAISRKVPDRDKAILAAFAFLQRYAKQRANQQEVLYNLGRAAHQIGLLHLAVPLYQRALAAEVPPGLRLQSRMLKRDPDIDLTREIAHNLALAYRSTGAFSLAAEVMRCHLTIR